METTRNQQGVVVVIGAGGIGQAIARRQGTGRTVLLADRNDKTLATAAETLESAGHLVQTRPVDVSLRESVHALAEGAAALGEVVNVVHTAGVSPVQASVAAVLAVDLVGTALVLEEFGRVIAPGGAGLVVSSMAGHMPPPLEPAQDEALARTPADELRPRRSSGATAAPGLTRSAPVSSSPPSPWRRCRGRVPPATRR